MIFGKNCTYLFICRKCELSVAVMRKAEGYREIHAKYQQMRTRDSLRDNYREKVTRCGSGHDAKGNVMGVTSENIYRDLKMDASRTMAQCLAHDLFEGAAKVSSTFNLTQVIS